MGDLRSWEELGEGGVSLCLFLSQACFSSPQLTLSGERVGKWLGKLLECSLPFMHGQGYCYAHSCPAFLLTPCLLFWMVS